MSLSDKDWKEYAEKQRWIEPDVVIQDDGSVASPKPELSEFFQNFERMYGDQGLGNAEPADVAGEVEDGGY